VPRKLYTFNGDERYLNEDMFNSEEETLHTLHQWIPLSSGVFLKEYHSQLAYANIATKKMREATSTSPTPSPTTSASPTLSH